MIRPSVIPAILLCGLPGLALAQEPAAETEDNTGEIVVTAQKIEQRALDVPITISATRVGTAGSARHALL